MQRLMKKIFFSLNQSHSWYIHVKQCLCGVDKLTNLPHNAETPLADLRIGFVWPHSGLCWMHLCLSANLVTNSCHLYYLENYPEKFIWLICLPLPRNLSQNLCRRVNQQSQISLPHQCDGCVIYKHLYAVDWGYRDETLRQPTPLLVSLKGFSQKQIK